MMLLGGLTAGCSSGAMRFSDMTDGLFTGSTANQRAIIKDQPYPGDQQTAAAPAEPVQPATPTRGTVSRSSLPPAGSATAAAPAPAEEKPVAAPRRAEPALDATTTGTVASAAPAADETIKGWSRAGGTQVTAKDGETVYNLSRRFGVPADIIMKMNGLTPENGLKVGQKIVIPTYVYSAKAGVSAPDSDPKTAEAKSSRGVKEKTPLPAEQQPGDKTAVLPNSPKVKESDKVASAGADEQKAGAAGSYTVVAGDSLSKIARKTGVSVAALKQANALGDTPLRIGQVLTLGGGATVAEAKPADAKNTPQLDPASTASVAPADKKPETGQLAEYTPPKTSKAIEQAAAGAPEAEAPDSSGIGRMRWPVTGKVVAGYGRSSGGKNDGIDISVPKGTPVKAAENGVVIYAGDGLKEFGNTVLVRHDNGLVTVYGYASELKVQRGQKVKRGEEIAVSGMSGSAKTPRLHFEVRKDSAPVDPKTYLE